MRSNRCRSKGVFGNQAGSVLILALWSLSMLAVFAATLGYGIRQKATLLSRLRELGELEAIAFSGIEKARGMMKLEDATRGLDTLRDDWASSPSNFKEVPAAAGFFTIGYTAPYAESFVYGLTDEGRKLNINTADVSTLTRLFQNVGALDKDNAEDVAYCIVDWRDSDSNFQHPNYGAEDSTYKDLPSPYEAKDGAFQVLDELLLIKGINRPIFDKIKPFLTVYGRGPVNVNTAPAEVLTALGMEPGLVDKVLSYRMGLDREPGTSDDRIFSNAPSIVTDLDNVISLDLPEKALLGNLVSLQAIDTYSDFFSVDCKAVLEKNGAALQAEAVIDRSGKIYYSKSSGIQWPSKA